MEERLLVSKHAQQKSLKEYFKGIAWVNPFSVTLTMKYGVWRDVSQNFRHYMNRLNQKFLGTRFRRYGEQLRVIPVYESGSSVNPHYHCMIDNPDSDRDFEFTRLVRECWWKTELSKPEVDIQKTYDVDGWIDYMVKFRTKTSLTDSVDWNNLHR